MRASLSKSILNTLDLNALPPNNTAVTQNRNPNKSLTCYLVGGAVRDQLLGLPVSDRDWVVVGSSPKHMQELGYRAVGKDFPVFLHPETNEEYALARTEKKIAAGYHGFKFNADPDISLQQDLERRDLTVNAIAQTPSGELIDPYGGIKDLASRKLRHVSDAFVEDPLRVLRVARFAAQLWHLGFRVAPETLDLIYQIGQSGELESLTPERIFAELRKALQSQAPRRFFETLRESAVLTNLFPEIDALFGIPQPAKYHPEIDTGLHTMMVLDQTSRRSEDASVRFASVCHDLGKAETPPDILPRHYGHEKRGAKISEKLCRRLRVPSHYKDLSVLTAKLHTHSHNAFALRPRKLLTLLKLLDALRRPERFNQFLLICEADARGRSGFENRDYPQANYLRAARAELLKIDYAAIAREVADKQAIAATIETEQLHRLARYKKIRAGHLGQHHRD